MNICLTVTGCCNVCPVNINCHSVVAVFDFACCAVYQINLTGNIQANRGVFAGCEPSVAKVAVLTSVRNMPTVDVFACFCCIVTANITCIGAIYNEYAVFKIVNNFRSFSETDFGSNCFVGLSADNCRDSTAFQACAFIASSEFAAADCTQSGI